MASRRSIYDGFTGDTFGDLYQPPTATTPGTQGPAAQVNPQIQPPAAPTQQWGGFDASNVFQNWDLNPLAEQTGMERDTLANERDAFIQPWEQQYKQTVGDAAFDDTSQNLWGDDAFRQFVQSGGQAPGGGQQSGGTQAPAKGGGEVSLDELMGSLRGMFSGGGFNQDLVNRRTEGAREDLNRMGKSRNATNRAALANRGLIGDGPEMTAQNRAESDIADLYSQAVSGIYGDESERADKRMMDSLGLAAGLFGKNADLGLARDRLALDEALGIGDLGLRNSGQTNAYNLDLARFGLDRDKTLFDMENGGIDQLMQLLGLFGSGINTASDGYF